MSLKENNEFYKELESLINRHNVDNLLNTPDFALASIIIGVLEGMEEGLKQRDKYYGLNQNNRNVTLRSDQLPQYLEMLQVTPDNEVDWDIK